MKPDLDVRVYLVSGEGTTGARAGRIVSDAIAGGVTIVQLRAKESDTVVRQEAARQVASVTGASGVPLIVNDDVDAAQATGVAGVHVGPDDVHPTTARALLGPDAIIGWSIHRLDQLADTDAVGACDYLAASPVWATSTKADITEPLGLDGVRALREAMPPNMPLVGIGGINEENAGDLVRAGADGVAVVSAIWSAPDPARAARRLREIVDAALAARREA